MKILVIHLFTFLVIVNGSLYAQDIDAEREALIEFTQLEKSILLRNGGVGQIPANNSNSQSPKRLELRENSLRNSTSPLNNQFTKEPPANLVDLSELLVFNISHNKLEESLPESNVGAREPLMAYDFIGNLVLPEEGDFDGFCASEKPSKKKPKKNYKK